MGAVISKLSYGALFCFMRSQKADDTAIGTEEMPSWNTETRDGLSYNAVLQQFR